MNAGVSATNRCRIAALCWSRMALRQLLLLLLTTVVLDSTLLAEQAWSVSPYRVRVWLALDPVPELDEARSQQMTLGLTRAAEATFGATWQLSIDPVPAAVVRWLAQDVTWPTLDTLKSWDKRVLSDWDKIDLVSVSLQRGGMQVQVREFDCRIQSWSPPRFRLVRQPQRLAESVAEEVIEAFTPIGLIGRSEEDMVEVNMRAGLLTGGSDVARLIPEQGRILTGILRKNDRLGQLAPNGLQPIPWTLMQVASSEYGTLECHIISGLRSPFRSRSSRQIERIALLVSPSFPATTLRLQARNDPSNRLAGYDVYYRLPDEKATELIGRTDWRGEVDIPRDEHPIKILYVKNGGRLLARLPMAPGYESLAIAELVDDSQRLEAEGFLKGIQEQMIEVKARQQVYALRIRKAIADQQLDKAESLLDELRSLQTREDLARKMRDRQQALSSQDRAVQDRIDKLFRDTRGLLQKHLTDGDVDQLRRELGDAKRGKG